MYSKMNGYPSSSFRSRAIRAARRHERITSAGDNLSSEECCITAAVPCHGDVDDEAFAPGGRHMTMLLLLLLVLMLRANSNYANYPLQDADFSSYSRPRMYGDMPSSSTFGGGNPSTPHHHHNHHHQQHQHHSQHHHHTSSSSTSSLTGMNFGPGSSGHAGTNLIVNYLPQDMTEREMYAMFSAMGPIESCRLMRDLKTGYSYGFGFVNYMTEDAAQRAIKCLNGYPVRNKRLKVSYARPQSDDIKETNLYITNLPRTITEEQLDIIFGKYGTIVQKNILRDKLTGQPRGVAFVRFNKREEAQEAISALNNVIPQGGTQPLIVRVAEDHGRAKAALYVPSYNSIVHNNRADGLDFSNRNKIDSYPY